MEKQSTPPEEKQRQPGEEARVGKKDLEQVQEEYTGVWMVP